MKKSHQIFNAFSKKKLKLYRHAPYIIITKQTSAGETFNIRQELGLSGLDSYANIEKVEIFHVLGPRHLTHDKVALLNIMGYI